MLNSNQVDSIVNKLIDALKDNNVIRDLEIQLTESLNIYVTIITDINHPNPGIGITYKHVDFNKFTGLLDNRKLCLKICKNTEDFIKQNKINCPRTKEMYIFKQSMVDNNINIYCLGTALNSNTSLNCHYDISESISQMITYMSIFLDQMDELMSNPK